MEKKKIKSEKQVPEHKKKKLEEIADLIKKNNTVMIALIENLSSVQFQKLKKFLSDKATIRVVKKTLLLRALEKSKESKKGIELLEKSLAKNFAVIFSNQNPFELAAIFSENKNKAYAKAGYVAKEDIIIPAGPTDLPAGPVISELSKAHIKASIDGGKIVIKEKSVVVKKGEEVSEDAARVLSTLEITPITISILPIAAYDSKEQKVYENIKVDKTETIAQLEAISRNAFNFALNLEYISGETITFLLMKASSHFNSLQSKVVEKPGKEEQEEPEETKKENNVQKEEKENLNSEENKT